MVFEHARALPAPKVEVNKTRRFGSATRNSSGAKDPFKKDPFRSQSSPKRHGYIRVSTVSQQTDRQVIQLRAECDELHIERISAVASDRPVFSELMATLEPGDTFVVVDLDRAFRSAIDAILTSEKLRARGITFRILSFPFDTASDEGELFFGIVAMFAQFERRIISRRTREGLQAARQRGVALGRPASLDKATVHSAHQWMAQDGLPCAYVSSLLGVSRLTLQRSFRREGLPYPVAPTQRTAQTGCCST